MISSRYVTIEYILEGVYNDYGFAVNKYEAAQWIWNVIGYLGIPYGLERKFQDPNFTVDEYKTPLPVDCYNLLGIKHKRLDYGLKRASSLYHINKVIEAASVTDETTLRIEGTNYVINDGGPSFDNTAFVSGVGVPINQESLVYWEQNESIYYGFKEGEVIITYDAFPLDQYKFPKVPDDAKYIRAVVTFIADMIATKGFISGKVPERVVNKIHSQYVFAAGAAQTKALTPDYDMMETIKQMSTRLIPFYNLQKVGFETVGNNVYRGLAINDYTISE